MKFLINNNNSPLLHIIYNLNPFNIISDFENERTEVEKLEIVEAIGVIIIYYLLIGTPAFPLGLLIGYLYIKTHSIYLCMLMHGLYNTFSFAFALYYPHHNTFISILFTVVGLVLIIWGFKKLNENINNTNIQKTLNID